MSCESVCVCAGCECCVVFACDCVCVRVRVPIFELIYHHVLSFFFHSIWACFAKIKKNKKKEVSLAIVGKSFLCRTAFGNVLFLFHVSMQPNEIPLRLWSVVSALRLFAFRCDSFLISRYSDVPSHPLHSIGLREPCLSIRPGYSSE